MKNLLSSKNQEAGVTNIEYGLMLALVLMVAIPVISNVGNETNTPFLIAGATLFVANQGGAPIGDDIAGKKNGGGTDGVEMFPPGPPGDGP